MTECKNTHVPLARLELAIFGLGGRRVIHYATEATNLQGQKNNLYTIKNQEICIEDFKV